MWHTEDGDVARRKRGQLPGNNGDDKKANRQKNDEQIRHDRRDDESASAYGDAVIEDDGHRIFQNGKCKRAEQDHSHEQNPADHLAVIQKVSEFTDQHLGLAGHDEFEILTHRRKQARLVDDVGEPHNHQNQQGNERQQSVIRDSACKEQALVLAE